MAHEWRAKSRELSPWLRIARRTGGTTASAEASKSDRVRRSSESEGGRRKAEGGRRKEEGGSDTHQLLFMALMGFAKGSTHPTCQINPVLGYAGSPLSDKIWAAPQMPRRKASSNVTPRTRHRCVRPCQSIRHWVA